MEQEERIKLLEQQVRDILEHKKAILEHLMELSEVIHTQIKQD